MKKNVKTKKQATNKFAALSRKEKQETLVLYVPGSNIIFTAEGKIYYWGERIMGVSFLQLSTIPYMPWGTFTTVEYIGEL